MNHLSCIECSYIFGAAFGVGATSLGITMGVTCLKRPLFPAIQTMTFAYNYQTHIIDTKHYNINDHLYTIVRTHT